MKISKTDMAKIQALLPEGLAFYWDNSAIDGLFFVKDDSSGLTVTLAADGWQRAVCPGSYLSVNGMPFKMRLVLPSGRGWHGVAANTIRALLAAKTVA